MTALTHFPKKAASNAQPVAKTDLWSQEALVELPDTAKVGWGVALFPLALLLSGLLMRLL